MNLQPVEATYPERSAQASRKVERRLVLSGWEKFRRGAESAKAGEKNLITAVRLIREAGLDWMAARDGQLTFNAFTQNWFDGVKEFLPSECQLQKMVYSVRVAELLKTAPKTLEDCKPALQLVLFATGLFPQQTRVQPQIASCRNPFNEVVTNVQRLGVQFEKYREVTPFEKWTAPMLIDFVRAARPLMDDVQTAEKLLEGMGLPGGE